MRQRSFWCSVILAVVMTGGPAVAQQSGVETAVRTFFQQKDADGDGRLSRAELGDRDLMSKVDADRDGHATESEAIAFLRRQAAELSRYPKDLEEVELKPLGERVAERDFPSVFMAWSGATVASAEDPVRTFARHDLAFVSPRALDLEWNHPQAGLGTAMTRASIVAAMRKRAALQSLNPNLILLTEIRYRDAGRGYLPDDHAWWKRDATGQRVGGWEEGGFFQLDVANEEFRRHVAGQCKAVLDTGAVDGVMLDWWRDDPDRLALLREVRRRIGDEALVLVNVNDRRTPESAPYVNGYFMECWRSQGREEWDRIAATLRFAEENLREPRVNCLETWFAESRRDLNRMRATTCLALTHSDGYCLFSDPNPLPTPDHRHDWYAFWDAPLGKPLAAGIVAEDGSATRRFSGGAAVYNPPGNDPLTVRFDTPHTSVATGKTAQTHVVPPLDGDIFLHPG